MVVVEACREIALDIVLTGLRPRTAAGTAAAMHNGYARPSLTLPKHVALGCVRLMAPLFSTALCMILHMFMFFFCQVEDFIQFRRKDEQLQLLNKVINSKELAESLERECGKDKMETGQSNAWRLLFHPHAAGTHVWLSQVFQVGVFFIQLCTSAVSDTRNLL